MFDFLKKKIQGWIGKEKEEKSEKKSKKTESKKSAKKEKKVKEVVSNKKENVLEKKQKVEEVIQKKEEKTPESSTKSKTISEQQTDIEVKQIIEDASKEKLSIDEQPLTNEENEEKKGNFFTRLIDKISNAKLSKEDFDEIFQEFEIVLLENNVALEAVDKIRDTLSFELVNQQIKKTEAGARVLQALKDSILSVVKEPPVLFDLIKNKKGPFVMLFFGINGTGKTTSIAKVAHYLKREGIGSVLAAGDTFRAASIEQLKIHGERLGVPVISQEYGSDPSAVAFDAIKYAEKHSIKVVLIDTAGRMYTKSNLLKEMDKIIRVSKPDLKIFVGESITGNDAVDQARTFNDTAGIDGIILSKADIDEKAGTILSVSHVTGKPIFFLGTGQEYNDLEPFTKKIVLKGLGLD